MSKPKIRFEGFADDWEQRKLGDTVQITMGQSPDGTTYSDIPSDYVLIQGNADLQNGWVAPRIWTSQMTKKADAGDLIMSVRAPAGAMGKTAYNAVIGRGVAAIKGNEFIYQLLVKMDSEGFWKSLSCGSTFGSLNTHNIKNADILIPDIVEQTEIGEYFSNLDHLITLHQRKCDEIKKIKKYMLQNMFPQEGEKNPKIRFDEFTDDWEQRKLGDCTFLSGKKNKNNLNLEPYAITNEHGFIPQNKAHDEFGYMKDTDRRAYNIVSKNSFAYNPARINIGSIGYYKGTENVIISSLYEVFQTVDSVYDPFLWQWFKTKDFQNWIIRLQEGSVRLYFYYDKLCECIIKMPKLEEQIKIANYLTNIDNLITLHQRKCDELKKMKKFMLQNMFV